MTTWTLGMSALFGAYMLAKARSSMSAVETLRLRVDGAWARFLRTSEPEDYEDFCRLKDRLTDIEEHAKESGDGELLDTN